MAAASTAAVPLLLLLLLLAAAACVADASRLSDFLRLPSSLAWSSSSEDPVDGTAFAGTKWALLIAGSAGYGNYRHQADICHAYQLLRRNGLKAENIVVFMADDVANNSENPRPGTLINKPDGEDVYDGVPKDYTGRNVTVNNFLAALKGDKSKVRGGSGKVVASGPDDHVFVFYSDHGGPGILGMPTLPFLFANDVVDALVAKHAAKGYKELVFYLEACESGSIFEGLLPRDINVYATTASNAMESSWGTYCPGMWPPPPPEYETCLGDLYSVAWMEDSDVHNLNKETLAEQYTIVKARTSNHDTFEAGSHVMQYGDVALNIQLAGHYLGTDPANENNPPSTFADENVLTYPTLQAALEMGAVNQRDAELLHLWHKYKRAAEGSERKAHALEEIKRVTAQRSHVDHSMNLIDQLLEGTQNSLIVQRAPGTPLVDDWDCLKGMVRAFETSCGSLTQYGMRHTRLMANLCNAGVSPAKMAATASLACSGTSYATAFDNVYSA